VLDPAALPGRYRTWLDAALTQHQVPSEPLLSVIASPKSFITSSVEFANQIRGEGHFYEMLRTLGADPVGPVIHLANGTARTTFTVRVKDDFYNRPGTYSGPCDLYKVFFNRDFQPDLPAGYFRELHGTLVITVAAVIPTQKTGGKVVLDDTALHIVDPSGIPC
jgi:hypothetical protein